MSEVWTIMENYLFFLHHAFQFRIHQFILMNNHFHLLTSTPLANIGPGMQYFMRETSRQLNKKSGRINQVYGGRFHRSLIQKPNHLLNVYKYNYRNPIEAGLSQNAQDYPYSTLQLVLGQKYQLVPLQEDSTLFSDVDKTLNWINTTPKRENYLQMKKALRKSHFEFCADQLTGKISELDDGSY